MATDLLSRPPSRPVGEPRPRGGVPRILSGPRPDRTHRDGQIRAGPVDEGVDHFGRTFSCAKNAAARLRISFSIFATRNSRRSAISSSCSSAEASGRRPRRRRPGRPSCADSCRRFRDPLAICASGLLVQPGELDRTLTELRRVGSGHRNILPETTIVASGSMSANPGEAQPTIRASAERPQTPTPEPSGNRGIVR